MSPSGMGGEKKADTASTAMKPRLVDSVSRKEYKALLRRVETLERNGLRKLLVLRFSHFYRSPKGPSDGSR